ncbi:hypothetical protein ScPMuIL_015385 [Solemya velum]
MGGTRRQEQGRFAERMSKKTHFNKIEIETLLKLMRKLHGESSQKQAMKSPPGSMLRLDRTKFRDLLHNDFAMTDDILMDRVFKAFDKDNDSSVNEEEWIMGLSTFLRGTIDEKTNFCFAVYDLNSDGYISREEIFHLLKNTLVKNTNEEDPDEGVKDLVELALKKMVCILYI